MGSYMKLRDLLYHLDKKGLSKPTAADPTIPPVLNLPEEEESTLISSKVDLEKLLKSNKDNKLQEGDWLDDCDIEIPKTDDAGFDNGDFLGDIQGNEIADVLGGKQLDVAGWYCPFHYYEENYGIYIKTETIRSNTRALIGVMTPSERAKYHLLSPFDKLGFSQEIKRAAFLSIFNHEMYHHFIESFATRLEMVNERPYFVDYHEKIYNHFQNPLHDNLIEEALASAYPLKYFRQNSGKIFNDFPNNLRIGDILCRFEFIKIINCQSPGYRGAKGLIKSSKALTKPKLIGIQNNKFGQMERILQQTILDCVYYPPGDIENWRYAPSMLKPYFNRELIVYEVLEPKTLSTVLPTSIHYLQLSPRKALKIASKNWGIITDGWGRGDHRKVKLPKSLKRIDFDTGYKDIPRKEWEILIEGMNEVLGSNYRNNEAGRRKFIMGP